MNPPTKIPIHQRVLSWITGILVGIIAGGSLFDAVNNVKAIITPRMTYTFSTIIITTWILIEVFLKKRSIPWVSKDGQKTKLTRLGSRTRLGLIGAISLLWVPIITDYNLNPPNSSIDTTTVAINAFSNTDSLTEPDMVEIPSGNFIIGSTDDTTYASFQKILYVKRFFISKFEITNELYRNFWESDTLRKPKFWNDEKFNAPNLPVVGVSWIDADAYCEWLSQKTGKTYKLPTNDQWEKAARGVGGGSYPWGDVEPNNKDFANFSNTFGGPMSVDSYPTGRNQSYGTMNMAGNVAEWTGDLNSGTFIRGGSWRTKTTVLLKCASRMPLPHHINNKDDVGFRVVIIP